MTTVSEQDEPHAVKQVLSLLLWIRLLEIKQQNQRKLTYLDMSSVKCSCRRIENLILQFFMPKKYARRNHVVVSKPDLLLEFVGFFSQKNGSKTLSKQGKIQSIWQKDITIGSCTCFFNTATTTTTMICPWQIPTWKMQLLSTVANLQPTVLTCSRCLWRNSISSMELRAASSPWLRPNWGQKERAGGLLALHNYNFIVHMEEQTDLGGAGQIRQQQHQGDSNLKVAPSEIASWTFCHGTCWANGGTCNASIFRLRNS